MRFRAESHLRRPGDFATVRAQGRRYHCGGFVLWALPRPPATTLAAAAEPPPVGAAIDLAGEPNATVLPARAGFVASRSAVGNAVQRNFAKRRLREVFRDHQDRVPPAMDLVFVARRSLNQLEYGEIERKFLKACADLFPAHSR